MTSARASGIARVLPLAGLAALYLAACRVMLAPIFNFRAPAAAIYEGDARLVAWALAWDNRFAAGAAGGSLFDANIFHPARGALAYGEHFFGISLFSLPVYLATHNAVLGYNVVWLLSYLLAAGAVHYLTWRLTHDHLGAFAAGTAFAFSFYRMHHGHGHLHLMWIFWIPLSFIAMERWVATLSWTRLAVFAAILVLQALASWYQAVMIFVADALFMLWLIACEPAMSGTWTISGGRALRLAVQSLAGAVIALALVWPFARHYMRPAAAPAASARSQPAITSGGPVELAAASADLTALLMPPQNTFVGRWLMRRGVDGPRWIWGELTLFVGWITLGLALAGAVAAFAARDASSQRLRFFVLLGICATALAFGPSAREVADNAWHWSAFGLLARIPGADLFRAPARFAALLTLALAVLAGAACAGMHRRFGRAGRLVTLAAIPLMLAEFYVVDFPNGVPPIVSTPPIYRVAATLPPGALVSLPDYAATPAWFKEANYQLYSTAHWKPIANGYSRAAPPGFADRMERLMKFPDASAVSALREANIDYVVVHAGDYAAGPKAANDAQRCGDVRLVAQIGSDYLFAIAK